MWAFVLQKLPICANAVCGTLGWSEVVKRIRTTHNGLIVNLSLRQESYAFVRLADERFSERAPKASVSSYVSAHACVLSCVADSLRLND